MTISSVSNLAQKIDSIIAHGNGFLVETASTVLVSGLKASHAIEIGEGVEVLGWPILFEDSSSSNCALPDIGFDLEPYRLTITKPVVEAKTRLLTNAGFRGWLDTDKCMGIFEVSQLAQPFRSYGMAVCVWDSICEFPTRAPMKSPRTLVRETSAVRSVPDNIRPWLLEESSAVPWNDPGFEIWAFESAKRLLLSLSSEVNGVHGGLVFAGHPKAKFDAPATAVTQDLGLAGFASLQMAAKWVYENDREAETRHRLFANEVARSSLGRSNVCSVIFASGGDALEGARLAFQLGVDDLSRDTLKVLGDLRKALGEEASKLADSTRQLAASVAGSLVLGLGLFAAKLGTETPKSIVYILAGILLGYVFAVIISNIQFVRLQRHIRLEWRGRLYRFLSDDDYRRMVTVPASRAERSIYVAMAIGSALAIVMFLAIIFVPSVPDRKSAVCIGRGPAVTPFCP
jgi:hypothetical protein